MSGLAPLRGHDQLRAGLAHAIRAGELPGSLLLHGAHGIGKQRLALWLGQILLCERASAEPCGQCPPCRLALRLEHPDLHWFFPLGRPKGASSPEKLGDALEEARAACLAQIRLKPLARPDRGEPLGFYIQQIQTLRRIATTRPAMGSRKIFVVGDAELLVPQESAPDAANALLKLLEEPPQDTTFILTAADPDALLPTIRSRLLPVRLQPLPQNDVAGFLTDQRAIPAEDADRVAHLAQGAIGRALAFLPDGDEPGPLEQRRREASALLHAAASARPADRYAAALQAAPAGARGAFSEVLDALAIWIRDLAAVAANAPELAVNGDALPELLGLARSIPHAAAAAPSLLRAVEEAKMLAYGNINPQLILAGLLRRLSEVMQRSAVA